LNSACATQLDKPRRILYRPANTFGETLLAHMLALDQGTTSPRAIVVDDRGMVVAEAVRPRWQEAVARSRGRIAA